MSKLLVFILSLCIVVSCVKEQANNQVQKIQFDDYFNLSLGKSMFYHVTYIYHDDQVDRHDTLSFKMKSVLEDTFIDNEKNLRFVINRYRWSDTIGNWVHYKTLSAYTIKFKNILIEDNVAEIKIFNPFTLGFKWNGNVYNNNDSLQFEFKNFFSKMNVNNLQLDSVIEVKQQLYQTYVDLKRKSEFYAKGKGMVYKVFKDLKIKKGDTLKVDKGIEWYYSLYQYN
jgi:hypothetical protein